MGEHIAGPRVTRRTMLKWSGAAGMLAVVGVEGCAPVATPGDGGSDANGRQLIHRSNSCVVLDPRRDRKRNQRAHEPADGWADVRGSPS